MAEAEPLVPSLVWLALFLGGALLIGYMCFYADPREPAFVQALMIGGVTATVVVGLLVVRFLDRPYMNASGSIKPTAMMTTLRQMKAAAAASRVGVAQLCDERGRPRGA